MRLARTLASTVALSVAFSGAIAIAATVVIAPSAVALAGGQLMTSYGSDNGNSMGQKASNSASGNAYDGGAVVVIKPELDAATIVDIDTFNQATCVVTDGGAVWCWGYASNNRLGSVPPGNFTEDLVQVTASGAREVALGYDSMCFTTSTEIKCIGSGTPSGSANPLSTNNPLTTLGHGEMPDGKVSHLTAGVSQYCAINDTDGHGYCWGRNGMDPAGANYSTVDHGAILGYGSWEPSHTPKAVKRTTGIGNGRLVDIAINQQHACAINSEGKAFCWGDNAFGELGNGFSGNDANGNDTQTEDTWEPVAVKTSGELQGVKLEQIAMVDDATCALSDEGEVFCWGNGNQGLLGDMLDTPSVDPVKVDLTSVGTRTVTDITHFGNSSGSFLLVADHEVFCWGPCDWVADSMRRDVDGNASNGRWSRPSLVRTTSAADMVVGGHSQMMVVGPAWATLKPGIVKAPLAYPASSGARVYVTNETRSIPVTQYVVTAQPGGKTCTIKVADIEGDPQPSCVVEGLTNGTAYTFTVAAKNDAGTSSASAKSNSVTPRASVPDAPGTPTDVALLPADGGFKVTFTAATSGGAATKYQYQLENGGPWLDATGTDSPITITGLTNGTSYSVKIRAVNGGGQSAPADAVTGTPADITGVPGAPTINSATGGMGTVQAQVMGASCAFPCATAAAYYEVQAYTNSGDPIEGATCTSAFGSCTVGSMSMSGWSLEAGSYKLKARGVNSAGNGAWSAFYGPVTVTAVMGGVPFGTPGAPQNIVVTPGDGSLTVTWDPPATTGTSSITGYTVMVAQQGGASCTVTAAKRTCTLDGLTNGTEYPLIAYATNSKGRGLMANTQGTPAKGGSGGGGSGGGAGVPSEVQNVEVVARSKEATVSWSKPDDAGSSKITGYEVTADPSDKGCETKASKTSCTVTGLTNGTEYVFEVVAKNASGSSEPVRSYAVTPGASQTPTPPRVVASPKNNALEIRWSPSKSAGSSKITAYRIVAMPGGKDCEVKAVAGKKSYSCTISGLTNGDEYMLNSYAKNSEGWSAKGVSGPAVPGTKPSKPRDLTVVSKSKDGTLKISWKAPASNGGMPITGYVVFWRLEDGNKLTTMPSVTTLERTITGLKPGARYRVSVAAVNKAGRGLTTFLSRLYMPK